MTVFSKILRNSIQDRSQPCLGKRHQAWRGIPALAVCWIFTSGPTQAETLYDAFQAAYTGNPVLAAQRAAVRVGVQDRAITATGFAPSVAATSDYGYQDKKGQSPSDPTTDSKSHPRGYGVTLSQNVWNGFRTINGVRRDDASVHAAGETLRDVEQQILVQVATAYADVLRDRAILDLRRGDLRLLSERAKQTHYRFTIGEITQTDVDQSAASLARSTADLTLAQSNLDTSVAAFQSVVGHQPAKLEPAGVPERLIPNDLVTAVAVAQAEHPAIRAARGAVTAAELNIDVEKGGYAPTIDLTASAAHRYDPDYYTVKSDLVSLSVMGKLSIPLYDRGLTYASVSRATEVKSERVLELDHQREEARANVIQTRGLFTASKLVIASAEAQIAASERALFGVELEATAGQRTTLDVLEAQRSLLDARVNREIAQHDRIIAGYRLLASIGRLALDRLTPADTLGRAVPPALRRGSHPTDLSSSHLAASDLTASDLAERARHTGPGFVAMTIAPLSVSAEPSPRVPVTGLGLRRGF